MTHTPTAQTHTYDTVRSRTMRSRATPWLARIDAAGATSRGRARARNEDSFIVAELRRCLRVGGTSLDEPRFEERTQAVVLAVADGMGGYGDGDTASAAALDSAVHYLFDRAPAFGERGAPLDEQRLTDALEAAFRHAQDHMVDVARERGLDPQLGTTLTLAYVVPHRAYLCHVGDSRAYRFRAGELTQLTHDQTVAAMLREKHGDDEASAAQEPFVDGGRTGVFRRFEHVLENAMGGGNRSMRVEIRRCRLRPGDRLLLCSDGLTNLVDDSGIARALGDDRAQARVCVDALVRSANAAGGTDNITAVAAFVRGASRAATTSKPRA